MQTQEPAFILLPHPKRLEVAPDHYLLKYAISISIADTDRDVLFPIAQRLKHLLRKEVQAEAKIVIGQRGSKPSEIRFEREAGLPSEGYILTIEQEAGVHIRYSSGAGAFYAVSTLNQLLIQCRKVLPCIEIKDAPDFPARGIMLDISRRKIPTLETLYRLVDRMADLKLNQLQLYIEGFSFAYESYPDVWKGETPITGEEVLRLDRYCRERYIELVPNQNSFGHMASWLYRTEFNDLAERPGGVDTPWGWYEKPFTLNPLDPRSIEFIRTTHDDLLPYFSSGYFNVGCDETFDLGQERSKEACERLGTGRVYLDFVLKVYESVKRKDKKMMMWGDIVTTYPELIPELPKDIIALEWGYSADTPSAESCAKFQAAGVPFYVCPGTSGWNSIAGFTDNMKANLRTAAINGRAYGAEGYLITDWGDCGHWQPLSVSYAGFAYGAALSWGMDANKEADLAVYLNKVEFRDRANIMGRFVLDLGNYYQSQKNPSGMITCVLSTLYFSQLDDTSKEHERLPEFERADFANVLDYVSRMSDTLETADLQSEEAQLIQEEFRFAVKLITHGAKLGLFKYDSTAGTFAASEQQQQLEWMIDELDQLINEFRHIWLKRNRSGGLGENLYRLNVLKKQYIDRKLSLRRSELSKD